MKSFPKAVKRPDKFTTTPATQIWYESPSKQNPYLAEDTRCYGYSILELADQCSFTQMLFLLLTGELPSAEEEKLLNTFLVGFANPGPRQPATRAAMYAGVGKTDPSHILPISFAIASGEFGGGKEVELAMRFLRKNARKKPQDIAKSIIENNLAPHEGDWHPVPGFGSKYGDIDIMAQKLAKLLVSRSGSGKILAWGEAFASELKHANIGWLMSGIAAATFADLGFPPRAAAGLFQIACAPGLLAHGVEMANKPVTAMPFVEESDYVIENI